MAISITFNGIVYSIPETGDESWGENLTSYFTAIPQGALQKTGGVFTLTADVNFGANFGLLSKYYKSRSANISTAGILRLAVGDAIGWRNNLGDADLLLSINGSDQLVFDGTAIYPGGITALTGDVLATGPGSVAATIAANAVTNSKLAQMVDSTVKANLSGGTANPSDVSAIADSVATTFMVRDANKNSAANNLVQAYETNVTAGGTTTLSVANAKTQYFTGSSNQDVVLPDATTVFQTGFSFFIVNQSSGTLDIKDNGGNLIQTLPASCFAFVTATDISSANGAWDVQFVTNNAGGGTVTSVAISVPASILDVTGSPITVAGTLQLGLKTQSPNTVFAGPTGGGADVPSFRALATSDFIAPNTIIHVGGQSGTYTPTSSPRAPLYIRVRAIGGGGGGGGAAASGATAGGDGGDTVFGSYTAAGGGGGNLGDGSPSTGDGGVPRANSGSPDIDLKGAWGTSQICLTNDYPAPTGTKATYMGGNGGNGVFGGAGRSLNNTTASPGADNTGGGGGGAGADPATYFGGGGGASGSYFEQIIANPTATSYSVGAGGAAGTGTISGAAGGSGFLIIEEHFQ